MKMNLTPAFVKSAVVQPGQPKTEYCDTNVPGLYLETRATAAPGQATWYLRYKNAAGKTSHKKLGTTANMSLAEARAEAKKLQAEIRLGADPRQEQQKQKAIPTLRQFWEQQVLPYFKVKKRSWEDDVSRMNYRILPKFGDLPLDCITRKAVVEFQLALKAEGLAAATCDHCVVLMRRILNLGLQWDVLATNPLEKIALLREDNKVEHYLTDEQLQRLLMVLQTDKRRDRCQVFLYLLSTGARLNEVLSMQWEQVDMAQQVWKVPAVNSKSKKLRVVSLNDTALSVLEELEPKASGWVFVQPNGERIKAVQRVWERVRAEAGVPFLRIHDLRHLYASFLINAGHTLYEVQNALGHSSPNVTQRYAHLSSDRLANAAASADKRLQAAMPKLLPMPPVNHQPAVSG